MKHFTEYIQNEYGIEVTNIQPYKNVWKADTSTNSYIIKSYRSPELINWIYVYYYNLRNNGFTYFPMLQLTKKNLPYFSAFNQFFTMAPFITGVSSHFTKSKDIENVIYTLSNFHHHSRLYELDTAKLPQSIPVYSKLENRLSKFTGLYDQILMKTRKDELDQKISRLGEIIISQGTNALALLDKELIKRFIQEANDYKLISHRDLASHNFIINNRAWLIDFDLAVIEPNFLDLWQILNRIVVANRWNLDVYYQTEELYLKNKKLRSDERILIRQLSKFPNDIIRECLGAYYNPKKFNQKNIIKYLDSFIENIDDFHFYQKNI